VGHFNEQVRLFSMPATTRKNFLRAFWDFFVLFSGISTASNLTRTQSHPVRRTGVFLFRPRKQKPLESASEPNKNGLA
jgi:hypothetical protein